MEIVRIQMMSLCILFISMVGMFILPYWYVSRKPSSFGGTRYQIGLSLANCLSGGVFIATFFVGLMPEVRSMFQEVIESYKVHIDFPFTECAMFFGFIVALGIEQSVLEYRERKKGIYASLPQGFPEDKDIPNSASFALKDASDQNSLNYDSDSTSMTAVVAGGNSRDNESVLGSPTHCHHHGQSHNHHGHSHDIGELLTGDSEIRLGMLMVSLGVHSIFEGLAIGLQTSVSELINLLVGVAVHELLVAFAMGVNVSRLRLKPHTVVKLALIFGSAIPAGQLFGLLIGHYQSSAAAVAVSATLQGIAAGTFIHVTFLEVIPAEFIEAGPRLLKVFFVALGFTLLLFCQVIIMSDGTGTKHHQNVL